MDSLLTEPINAVRRIFFCEEENPTARKLYALRLLISRASRAKYGFYLQRQDVSERVH